MNQPDEFEHEPFDGFETFNDVQGNTMIAWLDLLGMRNLPHDTFVKRINLLMEIAGKASAMNLPAENGIQLEVPDTAHMYFQYAIVGDALVITHKPQYAVSGDAKITARKAHPKVQAYQRQMLIKLLEISSELFKAEQPHRAAVTIGKVTCLKNRGALAISGEASIRAYFLEESLTTMGIYLDESCSDFVKKHLSHQRLGLCDLGKTTPTVASGPIAFMLGDDDYKAAINQYCEMKPENEKVINTKRLLALFT